MKAVALFGVGDIRTIEKEVPTIGDRDVLIRVGACGICGTDIHFFKGEWEVKTPLVLGHEFSGTIAKVGAKATNVKAGDRVVAEPNIVCGKCKYCRMSERNFFCENLRATGVTIDGAFAEYVTVPEQNVYTISGKLSLEEAALVEPLACIVRGLDNLRIPIGSSVAIVGAGPIGLLMTQVVKHYGASKIFAIDPVEERLKLAKDLGADIIIDPDSQNPKDIIGENTEGLGTDISIECVGSSSAIETALTVLRKAGKLLIFGVAPEHDMWHVKPFALYNKEVSIFTSYRSPYTFQRAVELASSESLRLKPIISHVYDLGQAPEVFSNLAAKKRGFIKALLKP